MTSSTVPGTLLVNFVDSGYGMSSQPVVGVTVATEKTTPPRALYLREEQTWECTDLAESKPTRFP